MTGKGGMGGLKDLDVSNAEHGISFLLMAMSLWPENGEKGFRLVTFGEVGGGKELDELSRQWWEGPWAGVLIFGDVCDMFLGGKSDTPFCASLASWD